MTTFTQGMAVRGGPGRVHRHVVEASDSSDTGYAAHCDPNMDVLPGSTVTASGISCFPCLTYARRVEREERNGTR